MNPDPVYNDVTVAKFINKDDDSRKKEHGANLVYGSFDELKTKVSGEEH